MSLVAVAGGCKKGQDVTYKKPGEPSTPPTYMSCPKIESPLPDGFIVSTSAGGGWGYNQSRSFYSDGRVVQTTSEGFGSDVRDEKTITIKLPASRMTKLDQDLGKVLLKEKQGCWSIPPHPEMVNVSIVYQHDQTPYLFDADSQVEPDHMRKAFAVLHALDQEVDTALRQQNPS